MIAFPELLVNAATKAKIAVPPNLDKYDHAEYPHWDVFRKAQLGQPMPYAGCHFDNAFVVAELSHDECKTVSWADLTSKGFAFGFSH